MSKGLRAYEACGCTIAIAVLDGYESEAYRDAAKWAKSGYRVEELDLEKWVLYCPEHPKGPPWWKRNGGTGKAPVEAPTIGLGL